jgi:hypothetical protein
MSLPPVVSLSVDGEFALPDHSNRVVKVAVLFYDAIVEAMYPTVQMGDLIVRRAVAKARDGHACLIGHILEGLARVDLVSVKVPDTNG